MLKPKGIYCDHFLITVLFGQKSPGVNSTSLIEQDSFSLKLKRLFGPYLSITDFLHLWFQRMNFVSLPTGSAVTASRGIAVVISF